VLATLAGIGIGWATDPGTTRDRSGGPDCKKDVGPTEDEPEAYEHRSDPLKQKVVLQPEASTQTRVTNFGADRDPEFPAYAVKSDRPIDDKLLDKLRLSSETIARTGKESAESAIFPEIAFTEPVPSGDRKRIRFRVCLQPPSSLPAGNYTGNVTLEGPPELEAATVTVTANAKAGSLFGLALVASLVLALLILLFKGAADVRAAAMKAAAGKDAEEQSKAEDWWAAAGKTATDLGWLAPTLFALGATFGILWALYENNPSWGSSGLGDAFALVGAAVAAVGAKAILTPSMK